MSEVHLKCVEVANLLTNNIIPLLETELDLNITEYKYKKDYVIYVLQLIETFNSSDEYIIINTDDLYYKLKELAEAIIFSDVGEVSTFQSSLYNKIIEICILLNPESNYEKEIRISKFKESSLSPYVLCFDDDDDEVSRSEDPIYEKITDIFNSLVNGNTSKDDDLSDKIDSLINLLDVKSPVRCKTTILNRLKEVNDAINLISKGENIVFTSYLEYQIDEIYTLLKTDTFYQKHCFLTEIKISLLALLHNIKNGTKKKFNQVFKKGKKENVCLKIFHVFCRLLVSMKNFIHNKFKEIVDDTCILLTIINIFILGSIFI